MNVFLIPFFVDKSLFYQLNKPKEEICKILNIDYNLLKDKIVISSFQRDSSQNNLNSPRPQKNPDLLIKILKNIKKEKYILLLAGPRRHYVIKKCEENNIPYLF